MVAPAVLWPTEHETALRALVAEGAGSHSVLAGILNEQFGSSYSRNAVIGKASRLGLSVKCPRAPVLKAVREIRVRLRPPEKPKTTEQQIAAFRCAEVDPKNVALTDLSHNGCRWPYGDGPFAFCDHPRFGETSYCGPHFALSIGPGTHSEQAATREAR